MVATKEPLRAARRHNLLTKELRAKIPKLYSQEDVKDPMIQAKFFSPYSNYTFYILEFDGHDRMFGYVTGLQNDELGYASFKELVTMNRNGLPLIERDCYFKPKKLSEVKK